MAYNPYTEEDNMAHPATLAEITKSSVPGPNPDVFEPPRAPLGRLPVRVTSTPVPLRVFTEGHVIPTESIHKFEPRDNPTVPLGLPSMPLRKFGTGATRDQDETKFDYEGFLSPLVLTRFAAYMHKNRVQSDGATRDSDNWQKGIPLDSYMKSLWRHLMTVWRRHRGGPIEDCEDIEDALCGVLFNTQGYLHEIMKAK